MSMYQKDLTDDMRESINDLLMRAGRIIQRTGNTIPPEWEYRDVSYLLDAAILVATRYRNMARPRGWLCVAGTRGKCGESAPIDSDSHKDCGPFYLEPVAAADR